MTTRIINNCTAIGNISGSNYVGGLLGSNLSSFGYTTSKALTYKNRYIDGYEIYCYIFKSSDKGTTYTYVNNDRNLTYYNYERNPIVYDLKNSYYSGDIMGSAQVGGLVGENGGGNITCNYSYSNVYGTDVVGGIVGKTVPQTLNGLTVSSSIKSNMAISSTVSASSSEAAVGRIYGTIANTTTIGATGSAEGNSALTLCKIIQSGVTQTVLDNDQNGVSIGPSLLKLKATYVAKGWNFDSDWNILETESYPYKKYQAAPPVIESELVSEATTISGSSLNGGTVFLLYKDYDAASTNCSGNSWSFSTEALQSGAPVKVYAEVEDMVPSCYTMTTVGFPGSGTEADPYRIYTAEDLQGANKIGYYKLMNDIDLTSWINENSPTKGWVPIGLNSNDATYIDGDNHKVTGLWINTTDDYTGLFSNYSSGEIKNLTVEVATGKKVKGGNYTGILIGRMANGTITNCTVSGDVEGSQYTGGIVGYADNTPMTNLKAEGQVAGTSSVGGMAGYVGGASPIEQCSATSTITATGNAGGLVGDSSAPISKSKADVTITVSGDNSNVGGLVGNTTGSVQLSFASGTLNVTGAEANTGGLIGYVSGTTVNNCYSTANVSGTQYSAGLVAYALNTAIDKCYSKGDISGVNYGGGLVAQLDGSGASLSNSVAANNILSLSAQSSWGSRVIGGYKNGAPEPEDNNYALSTMQVSLNGVPQTKTDDPVEGIAKTANELMGAATYQGIEWDFSTIWGVDEGEIYPYLLWEIDINPVVEISFDKTNLLIAMGKTETITATVLPLGATNKRLNWTSSNEAVATVENGVVTAVAVGSAVITATAADGSGVATTCQVTVTANKDAAIAALQELVAEAQALYDNSTEGENIGEYASGSRATLLAVINSVNAQISSTMSDEALNQCTDDITAAINQFQSQQVTAGEDTDYSTIANTIYLERVEAAAGSQLTLSVKMKNTVEVQGYQFDLYLPEGVTVAADEDGFSLIELSTERTTARKTDYFNSTNNEDGSFRVLCGSSKGYAFDGTDGEVAVITLNISTDMEEGEYPIILKNVVLTDKNSGRYPVDYLKSTLVISSYTLGDVNADGFIDVTDFICVANDILGQTPEVFIRKAADIDGNDIIDVADFIGVANLILSGAGKANAPKAAKAVARRAATPIEDLDDVIYVEPVTVTPGSRQTLSIQMKNSGPVAGFQFRLQLPEGITVAQDEEGFNMVELSTERTTARKTDYFNSEFQQDGTLLVLCGSSTKNPSTGRVYTFSGNEGEVARITIDVPADYPFGVYEVSVLDGVLSSDEEQRTALQSAVTSELTIGDNSIVLDENSTEIPEATDGDVNILVKRTLKKGQWSTICLPFDITAEQVYEVFGDEVQLQEFTDYEVTQYDDEDKPVSILVRFADIDIEGEGFYANYPYLIKTPADISEFRVTATITPDEENAVAEYDNGKTGRQRKVYGSLIGTYHAQTVVPQDGLFLNDNKFWYSTGETKMKAFRAYFMFNDVISFPYNSGANIDFVFDGTSAIRGVKDMSVEDGMVYTLQGQFLGKGIDLKKLPRGIYIINGKKQVIK